MSLPAETTPSLTPEERRQLLARMIQERASRPAERPLSPGQERLRLMARLEPDSALYHIAVAHRLVGPLDLAALERAVRRIAGRHEVLRAAFPAGVDRPIEVVADEPPPAFSVTDLRGLPERERQARIDRLAAEASRRPFDLERGPLWRVEVLRWSDEGHDLVLAMHHLVSDAWSFAVFGRELAECYEADLAGRAPALADLPISYAEFGQRQRQWLSGPTSGAALSYWRGQLDGEVPGLRLPADRPGQAAMDHRGSVRPLTIPGPTASAMSALSRGEQATPFMTLLAGFAALLHRYSGQEDLVLCTPSSGRHRAGTRDLIGYFNNILPLRLDLRGDPPFVELVRKARRVALDAFKHQDLPFQVIADAPNLRAVPLGRVLFSLDMAWPPKLALAGLPCESRALRTDTSDFDLNVSIWEEGDEFRGVIEYKTGLFDGETIERLIADYLGVLAAVAEDPGRTIATLPVAPRPAAADPAHGDGRAPVEYQPPRFPTELRILKEWEDILNIRPIGLDDDLFELGATSLGVARLSERIRKLFRVELPLASIFQARTVMGISALVRDRRPSSSASALAPIRPEGSLPPLFLCEGIGIYYPMIRHLDPEQPVYALVTEMGQDYPRVEALAAAYIDEVRTVQPEGPYFLGGLSFGGLVAFEMAQQLFGRGEDVGLLALFDTPTPWASRPKPPLRRVAGHLANLRRFRFAYVRHKLGRRLAGLRRRLEGRRGSAHEILADEDRLRHLLGSTAAHYEMRAYPGRIALFALAERDGMSDALFDPALDDIDPQLGWDRVAPGRVSLHEVPGEHVSMFREPHVRVLAEELTGRLAAARGASRVPAGGPDRDAPGDSGPAPARPG